MRSMFLHADSEDCSDWAEAQADLSLRWAHRSFCWLFCAAAQILGFLWQRRLGLVGARHNLQQDIFAQLISLSYPAKIPWVIGCPLNAHGTLMRLCCPIRVVGGRTFNFVGFVMYRLNYYMSRDMTKPTK